jgi:hypothetical protein
MFKMLNGIPFVFLSTPDAEYNEKLRQFALAMEPQLLGLPVTGGWEDVKPSPSTARYGAYNTFLLDPITWPLLNLIRAGYWLMIQSLGVPRSPKLIESWFNVHRGGEHLHRHTHYYPIIGNYSVNAEPSSTIYGAEGRRDDDVEVVNKNGQLVMTVGYPVYHEVTPWTQDEPRITIACDIVSPEMYHPGVFVPFDA